MTTRVNAVRTVGLYIKELTSLEGHFTFLDAGAVRVAVFRRPSFLQVDETTITRERLMSDVEPKIQSSVFNGFLVWDVLVGRDGETAKCLEARKDLKSPQESLTERRNQRIRNFDILGTS